MNILGESLKGSMIDMHCHMMFDVDDGAKTIRDSFELILNAYKKGINKIIFTPHYRRGRFRFLPEKVKKQTEQLKGLCADYLPEVSLYTGSEIYYNSDVPRKLRHEKLLTLANSRYVLLEFSPSANVEYISQAGRHLMNSGYFPIIAHVERYACMIRDFGNAERLMSEGCFIQVDADSVVGKAGRMSKAYCNKLLKHELVSFVASDCHDMDKRPNLLDEAAEQIIKKYGAEYAWTLFHDNPSYITQGKLIGGNGK